MYGVQKHCLKFYNIEIGTKASEKGQQRYII